MSKIHSFFFKTSLHTSCILCAKSQLPVISPLLRPSTSATCFLMSRHPPPLIRSSFEAYTPSYTKCFKILANFVFVKPRVSFKTLTTISAVPLPVQSSVDNFSNLFKIQWILPSWKKKVLITVQLIRLTVTRMGNIWVFFSSRSLKMREKCISFARFLYFLREVYLLFYFGMIKLKNKHTSLKKYTN